VRSGQNSFVNHRFGDLDITVSIVSRLGVEIAGPNTGRGKIFFLLLISCYCSLFLLLFIVLVTLFIVLVTFHLLP
jgi:hypothetical protein